MSEKNAIRWWIRLLEATSHASFDGWYMGALLLFELLLCSVVLIKVPYTEIDWIAYMEEVEGFENGERDYVQIRGGTGPLVYPAGFLYLFAILKRITNTDVQTAQYIFLLFYMIHQWIVLMIYQQAVNGTRKKQQSSTESSSKETTTLSTEVASVWSWRIAMATTCLSKRIHSIFILRLFNDGPTMLLTYLSIWLFSRQQWNIGCFIFSLAVSIKMNVLLFAPGLLLLLLQVKENLVQVIQILFWACALPQLVLGAPFLITYPQSYIRKAFELDRVFFYKWTVNWKFLDEDFFLSKKLAISLLLLHLACLAYFCIRCLHVVKSTSGNRSLFLKRTLSPNYIISTLLTSNFIGIVFARTLHYQFYAWYFHALPFLLWNAERYPVAMRIILLIAIESSFLTYPATPISSGILQVAHLAILLQIRPNDPFTDEKAKPPRIKSE